MTDKRILENKTENFSPFIKSFRPIFPKSSDTPKNKLVILDSLYSQCNICLYYYLKVYYTENCKHYLCEKCLKVWTQIKKICPVCKCSFNKILLK